MVRAAKLQALSGVELYFLGYLLRETPNTKWWWRWSRIMECELD